MLNSFTYDVEPPQCEMWCRICDEEILPNEESTFTHEEDFDDEKTISVFHVWHDKCKESPNAPYVINQPFTL